MRPNYLDGLSHAMAFLRRRMVEDMRLLTVATEPRESLAVGTWSTKIWKATVRREPVVDKWGVWMLGWSMWWCPGGRSGKMENPEGRSATQSGSPPFKTAPIAAMSTGAYATTYEDSSAQHSCKMSMFGWFELTPYTCHMCQSIVNTSLATRLHNCN